MELNKDFANLLRALTGVEARYLLVGALAVEYHGQPRSTRHMDLWVDDSPENMERVYRALTDFGVPTLMLDHLNAAPPLDVVWIGVPPNRIDLAKGIRGLDFATCWDRRVVLPMGDLAINVIGKKDLIQAKRTKGRAKDLADAEALENFASA
jgi:hypothetical protein